MVLELFKRWGKNFEFEGGKLIVNCSIILVVERFFISFIFLILKYVVWYLSEILDFYVVLLILDNVIRIYLLCEL